MSASQLGTIDTLLPDAVTTLTRDAITHVETVQTTRAKAQDRGNLRALGTVKTVNDVGLALSSIEINYMPGELAQIKYTYGGNINNTQVNPADNNNSTINPSFFGASSQSFDLDVKLRTVSILRHKRYKDLSADNKRVLAAMIQFGLIDENGRTTRRLLDASDAKARECANFIEAGVVSFEAPVYTLRLTEINTYSKPSNYIGRINEPPLTISIPTGENWLLVGARGKYAGGQWTELVTEWESSGGSASWDDTLYK